MWVAAVFALLVGAPAFAAPGDPDPPDESAVTVEHPTSEVHAREEAALEERLADREAQIRREITAQVREELAREQVAAPSPEPTGFGKTVTVAEGQEVEEVSAFGADVVVEGRVVGDAVSFGGDVHVRPRGVVGRSAVSFGGRIVVDEGGVVHGDRVAMNVPSVAMEFLPRLDPSHATGALPLPSNTSRLWDQLQWRLVLLLSVAGAGVLVVGLFPARVSRVARDLEFRPVRAAILGALSSGFILVFSVLFALLTLGLGLPISMLLLCGLGIAWLLGFVALCQAVGDRLPLERRPHGRWLAFLVGVVLVTLFGSLPWVGGFVVVAASVVGVGAAVSTRLGSVTAAAD